MDSFQMDKRLKHLDPRAAKIIAALNLSGKGVEYGPMDRPLVPKPEYSVSYLDYADRAFLAEKFRSNPNRNVELIPEMDIVTGGKLITEFVPESSLDYIVASHVMEHVPDFLGWLESSLCVLKGGGRIAVAYPDKRYCFDLKRKSSSVSDILAASLEKRTQPTFPQICDHIWNAAKVVTSECWAGKTTPENAPYLHSREHALSVLRTRATDNSYFDCHCWVFSDTEFIETLKELKSFSSIPFEIVSFNPTQRNTLEFYVTLERCR
jgi:predicted SAM-dependent methyltransferase